MLASYHTEKLCSWESTIPQKVQSNTMKYNVIQHVYLNTKKQNHQKGHFYG